MKVDLTLLMRWRPQTETTLLRYMKSSAPLIICSGRLWWKNKSPFVTVRTTQNPRFLMVSSPLCYVRDHAQGTVEFSTTGCTVMVPRLARSCFPFQTWAKLRPRKMYNRICIIWAPGYIVLKDNVAADKLYGPKPFCGIEKKSTGRGTILRKLSGMQKSGILIGKHEPKHSPVRLNLTKKTFRIILKGGFKKCSSKVRRDSK